MVSCCSRISKLFFLLETSESLIEAEFHQIKHPLVIQFVTFLGCLCDPFQWLSHLKLGDEKVTAWITCHLATLFSFSVLFRVPLDLLRPSSKQKLRWRSHHPDWAHHHFGGLGRVCARCFRGNSELLMAWSWVNRSPSSPNGPIMAKQKTPIILLIVQKSQHNHCLDV